MAKVKLTQADLKCKTYEMNEPLESGEDALLARRGRRCQQVRWSFAFQQSKKAGTGTNLLKTRR